MTFTRKFSLAMLALAASMPLALPGTARAQNHPNGHHEAATIRVDAFDVEQLRRVTPGSGLDFTLSGTPGANVSLRIAGGGDVRMTEGRPGTYTGSYTVRNRDRVNASSLVTARLERDGQVVTALLNESLVRGAKSPAPLPTSRITAFDVSAPDRVRAGDELNFSLTGTPGGKARASVRGVAGGIVLTESTQGVYEGRYTVRRQDRMGAELLATGFLTVNGKEVHQPFERHLADRQEGPRHGARDAREQQPRASMACANCGVIETVNMVAVKSDSSNVLGTIAGGVVGGVLGHQVGGGTGKDLATVAGAVGGAYAGNRLENNMSARNEYRVVVRLDSGAAQTFSYPAEPSMRVGARVKIDNGSIVQQ
jgi:outer membrane lipoprotein SlyB